MDFSNITFEDLKDLGVEKKSLTLVDANLTKLAKGMTAGAKAQIKDLHATLSEIYECVNMDVRLLQSSLFILVV